MIDLCLTWTKQYDRSGFKLLKLDLRNNGKVVDSVSCYSGAAYRQQQPFVHPKDDWSKSMRPIPEGLYSIGKVIRGNHGPGLGAIWISIDVLPNYRANNRSAFGFHDDENRATARGSAGCVVFYSMKDLESRLVKWLESDARPQHLVVDWGVGFLASRGYKHPTAAPEVGA